MTPLHTNTYSHILYTTCLLICLSICAWLQYALWVICASGCRWRSSSQPRCLCYIATSLLSRTFASLRFDDILSETFCLCYLRVVDCVPDHPVPGHSGGSKPPSEVQSWTFGQQSALCRQLKLLFTVLFRCHEFPLTGQVERTARLKRRDNKQKVTPNLDVSIEEETHQEGEPTGAGGAIATTGACAYMPLKVKMGVAKYENLWKNRCSQCFGFSIDSPSRCNCSWQVVTWVQTTVVLLLRPPTNRRLSDVGQALAEKEADHVEESIAKQQQDVGAREVLEDVYLKVFELVIPPSCLCFGNCCLASHSLVVLSFWCIGLLRLFSNHNFHKRYLWFLRIFASRITRLLRKKSRRNVVLDDHNLRSLQNLSKVCVHVSIIQNVGWYQAMQNEGNSPILPICFSVNNKILTAPSRSCDSSPLGKLQRHRKALFTMH